MIGLTLLQIIGVVVMAIGIWMLADRSSFLELTKVNAETANLAEQVSVPGALQAVAITLIVAGGITFIIAFLGCFGAIKEWRPLLILVSSI